MLEFQFIKNALGLQEKDHIVCENDGKILNWLYPRIQPSKLARNADKKQPASTIIALKP